MNTLVSNKCQILFDSWYKHVLKAITLYSTILSWSVSYKFEYNCYQIYAELYLKSELISENMYSGIILRALPLYNNFKITNLPKIVITFLFQMEYGDSFVIYLLTYFNLCLQLILENYIVNKSFACLHSISFFRQSLMVWVHAFPTSLPAMSLILFGCRLPILITSDNHPPAVFNGSFEFRLLTCIDHHAVCPKINCCWVTSQKTER